MKQEVLERLTMDRALDGLPPDVETLLDAYLAKEPEEAERTREINNTVTLARQALKSRRPVSLPPLKVVPLQSQATANTAHRRMIWPAQIAAAFIVGLALGLTLLRQPASPHNQPVSMASAASDKTASESTFWSAQRLMNRLSTASPPRPPRLSWTSPVQKPQLNNLP